MTEILDNVNIYDELLFKLKNDKLSNDKPHCCNMVYIVIKKHLELILENNVKQLKKFPNGCLVDLLGSLPKYKDVNGIDLIILARNKLPGNVYNCLFNIYTTISLIDKITYLISKCIDYQ